MKHPTKIIQLDDHDADDLIASHFGVAPIIMQLPTVFALYAPATWSGAEMISRCKRRLPGKTYGVNVGDPAQFFQLARKNVLADYLLQAGRRKELENFAADLNGTFLRIDVGDNGQDNPLLRDGRLQGLFFSGILGEKMRLMEALTRRMPDKLLGSNFSYYAAPIATSCNISGDPGGSITDFHKALGFAAERGVQLMVLSGPMSGAGSQPVLEIQDGSIAVHRNGPGWEQKIKMLQSWIDKAEAELLSAALGREDEMMPILPPKYDERVPLDMQVVEMDLKGAWCIEPYRGVYLFALRDGRVYLNGLIAVESLELARLSLDYLAQSDDDDSVAARLYGIQP